MLLDPGLINAMSAADEAVAEKQFKKLGFAVERLDRQGPRKRPEFLVRDTRGPLLIAEVKTIVSAGYLRDVGVHVSTLDPRLSGLGAVSVEVDFHEEVLTNAVGKLECLVEDRPDLADLPFTVVLFADVHADHFQLMPAAMPAFPAISGLLKVESDYARDKAAKRMSKEELQRRAFSGDMRGLPAASKGFVLLENQCASVKLPPEFVESCIVVGQGDVST